MSDFSNDDLKINKTLKVDDRVSEPEINLVGSLDLSNKPAGSYYYNAENNYNYTKNWFNYNRLDSVNNEVVINEVVQYSKPELTPGILDTSKTYSLSSTSMNAIWAARIETGSNGDTSGYSGVDAVGNTYLLVNYTFPNNATVYNADDTITFTKLNNGPGSTSTCLAKFNAAGTALWAIRIVRSIPGDSTVSQFCITDNQGTTYIVGTGGSDVIFEDASGTPVYTVNMPGKDYLVAYDSNGTPDWVTYFTEGFRSSLWVDNQPIGNVYLTTGNSFAPTIFYDSVPAAPTPVLAAGRTIAFGTEQIVKVERSAGGDATVRLYTLAANLNLFSGMSIALLGLINDGGSFNTFDPVVITVTDYVGYSTITYFNPTGSMPYVLSNTEGSPVITATGGGALAKFRSSSGLFQWAATVEGFRVGGFLNFVNYSNQSITTDLYGNVYTTGYYTYFSLISNAATSEQPVFKDSGKTLPPYSSPIIWNPVEDNRNWTGIAINDNGNIIVATVGNGYIYVSTDAGSSWNQRATIQNWSSVYCNDTGLIMVATIMDSVIYRSIDGGLNWIITNGEGSNARNWVAIAGNFSGSNLVALDEGGIIYYSTNFGLFWSASSGAPSTNWIDVAYDSSTSFGPNGSFTAIIDGGGVYTSIDGGMSWTTNVILFPAPSTYLSAITGTNDSPYYRYLVTEKNGKIYGINTTGNWNVLDNKNRNYNDIAASSNLFYATVYNGAIYQSAYTFETSWTPTTIPRFWNRVAVSSSFADPTRSTAVATIPGGQIYIAKESYPVVNAFVIKYNPEGQVQWVTYIDTKNPEGTSSGFVLTSQSNGNIILGGFGNRFDMYNSTNYSTPVKSVNNPDANKFIACYSNDGIPLWVNTIGTSVGYSLNALSVDTLHNIYCIFGSQPLELYQPTNQLIYSQNTSELSGVLIKYYPNGFVQSSTRMEKTGELFGTSIRVLNQGDIYLSGWAPIGGLTNFYDSPGNTGGITRTLGAPSAYVCKYSSNTSSSFPIPEPEYNTVFDTQLRIGGSTRKIEGGYIGDGSIELWGGQTGLLPSDINIADANAGVISYLGHQPGYTIPTVDGLQEFNPNVYRFLTVGLSEPTFPINDPQPISPGTIPYGYLPFYVQCPNYTTGLVFNNMLDNSSNLVLSTTGVISASGLEVSGLFSGDIIRILIHNGFQSEYVTLTVKGIIVSDIIYGFQTGIMFEENTRYLASIFGTTQQATATLISNGTERYLPTFYLPSLVKKGTLKLILQLYPKPT